VVGSFERGMVTLRDVPLFCAPMTERHFRHYFTWISDPQPESPDARFLEYARAEAEPHDTARAESAAHRLGERNHNLRANAREEIAARTKERDEALAKLAEQITANEALMVANQSLKAALDLEKSAHHVSVQQCMRLERERDDQQDRLHVFEVYFLEEQKDLLATKAKVSELTAANEKLERERD
jgi:hypothetical protein